MNRHNHPQRRTGLLGAVCLFGLVVFLILLGVLLFLSLYGGVPLFSPGALWKGLVGNRGSFAQALEEYDQKVREDPPSPRQRNALLDSLEKKSLDTENTLSVLKRRRALALHAGDDSGQYFSAYIEAAQRARKAYPFSAQVGALAAEALILNSGGTALSEEGIAEMRDLAALMSQGALQDISLALSVYSGAMGDPASARFLPRELFTLICSLSQGEEREAYLVNACIRTVLEGDTREAIAMVNSLFDAGLEAPPLRKESYRFGGEFFYDHGNFLRAAELFSFFTDDRGLARQGDALWLANFIDSARGLWTVAASSELPVSGGPSIPGDEMAPAATRARALYNLASSAAGAGEEGRWLERLFAENTEYQDGRIFGIIRYSRLAPLDRALAILEQAGDTEGLFDLEMLRRRSAEWTVSRTVAETWLLLNRHPHDGRLFEWAVWYFDFQHRYEESALALRNAGINRVEGPWSGLHRAFAQVRENLLDEAEKTLRSITRSSGLRTGMSEDETEIVSGRRRQPLWQADANLGLLLEAAHNPQEALQHYEIAAGLLFAGGQLVAGEPGIPAAGISPERRDAARIQLRIAGVLRSLGKEQESIRALDYAMDLDPENLEARLEKRRLDNSRGVL
jgi:tetratricopeptide (TPR) repeat protein